MANNHFFEKDSGFNELMGKFKVNAGESAVFVGYLRSSGLHKKKPGEKGKPLSMAQVAAIHEFGAPSRNIPERSFMRSAIDKNSSKLQTMLKKLTRAVIAEKMPTKKALGILGQFVVQLMKDRISQNVPPPNAPATVAAKGSSHTLIDTGQLVGALDWQIKTGKGE